MLPDGSLIGRTGIDDGARTIDLDRLEVQPSHAELAGHLLKGLSQRACPARYLDHFWVDIVDEGVIVAGKEAIDHAVGLCLQAVRRGRGLGMGGDGEGDKGEAEEQAAHG